MAENGEQQIRTGCALIESGMLPIIEPKSPARLANGTGKMSPGKRLTINNTVKNTPHESSNDEPLIIKRMPLVSLRCGSLKNMALL